MFLDAIAALRPSAKAADDSKPWRTYRLLQQRYEEALDPAAVQERLGISKSLYYLEHERAVQAVASLLREQWLSAAPPREAADEVARVPASPTPARSTVERLPQPLTSFLGREQEIAAIRALFGCAGASTAAERDTTPVRLLTLTGPAGTGKTRLSLQVAATLARENAWDVRFVELASLSENHLLLPAIARALGVREGAGGSLVEGIAQSVAGRDVLVVLDNFEQVLGAAARVTELLHACPQLSVLVTSRAALRVYGEREFPVPPLDLPERAPPGAPQGRSAAEAARSTAVRLFEERARAVKPDFALDDDNTADVVEICRRLDALPLAIELAAARSRLLPPAAILARLDSRLTLLTGGARDLPVRQQTLREAIAWSYDLLEADEQALFRRLAVFGGTFSISAVEAVCNPSSDIHADLVSLLESLVSQSLVKQEEEGGEPRLHLLQTIHEYAWERLAQADERRALRDQHAAFYGTLVREATSSRSRFSAWIDRLETEHGNVRAMLHWLAESGQAPRAMSLAFLLRDYWLSRGHIAEAQDWLEGVLALPEAAARGQPRAQGLLSAGILACVRSSHERATALLEECISIAHEVAEPSLAGAALRWLGNVKRRQGDFAAAQTALETSLSLAREANEPMHIAQVLGALGELAREQDEHDRAGALYEQSLPLLRAARSVLGLAVALHNLGQVELTRGQFERAGALFQEALALVQKQGNKRLIADCLAGLAGVAAGVGAETRAAELAGAAQALIAELGVAFDPVDQAAFEHTLQHVRAHLDAPTLHRCWTAGQHAPLDELVERAMLAPV